MNLNEIREKLKTKPVLIASENFREETLAHRPGSYEFNTEEDKLECVKLSHRDCIYYLRIDIALTFGHCRAKRSSLYSETVRMSG